MSRTHTHPPGIQTCFWCSPTISGRIMFGNNDPRAEHRREALYVPPDGSDEVFRQGRRRPHTRSG